MIKKTVRHLSCKICQSKFLCERNKENGCWCINLEPKIINENTGLSTFIDLVPHINLVDNFHYARNISLPGSIDDLYSVRFNVISPTKIDLSLHKDWLLKYGEALLKDHSFYYQGVNFKDIAKARRK